MLTAKNECRTDGRDALEILCKSYWHPLYSYIRHKGYSVESAKDLTQEFFATFLAKDYLKDVEPAKGRFRSFLLASLKHFLAKERAKNLTQKRGGRYVHVPLDVLDTEWRYADGPSHSLSPEALFDAEWARTSIELALRQLETEYAESGKSRLFAALRGRLSGVHTDESYRDLASSLGMSVGATKVAVHRLRRRYGTQLRQVIADTVGTAEEVDEELKYLAKVAGC